MPFATAVVSFKYASKAKINLEGPVGTASLIKASGESSHLNSHSLRSCSKCPSPPLSLWIGFTNVPFPGWLETTHPSQRCSQERRQAKPPAKSQDRAPFPCNYRAVPLGRWLMQSFGSPQLSRRILQQMWLERKKEKEKVCPKFDRTAYK